MNYGKNVLSIVPMRITPNDDAEMVNQILYGEVFKVLEVRKKWSRVRLSHDTYEGWIDNKQFQFIEEDIYTAFAKAEPILTTDIISLFIQENQTFLALPMGSTLRTVEDFDSDITTGTLDKSELVSKALLYLNAPYLWGGRTPMGIDCSGFTQMVYRLCGYSLNRDASQQATQGEVLSFIEESEPGDLAFFDNSEGSITHVGIIMENNYIIHAHGQVRIDRLDQSGIFNVSRNEHSHKLRVIKKII